MLIRIQVVNTEQIRRVSNETPQKLCHQSHIHRLLLISANVLIIGRETH